MIDKINKLSLPATILIASIVLGGFYCVSELNKQASIERQQQAELQVMVNQKSLEALQRSMCVSEAEESAQDLYRENCTYNCKEGQYYVANYDNAYSRCLQGKGLK